MSNEFDFNKALEALQSGQACLEKMGRMNIFLPRKSKK